MSAKESHSLSSVEKCSDSVASKDLNFPIKQVEVEREVITDPHIIILASDSTMTNTKQMA